MAYKIDPEFLTQVCKEVLDLPVENGEMFSTIIEKISNEYPGIVDKKQRRWIGSRAGGVLGKLTFLYISLTEYLIIFGCPAGTQGFSGRYNFMEIWDFFLSGKTITYDLESDQIAPTILLPGDVGHLGKGQSLGVEIQSGSWMIEYGRGPNITALPFALMDSLVSSVELGSFFLTMSEYTRFMIKRLF
jgi:hypothetical protein